jgi:hypothetical protein
MDPKPGPPQQNFLQKLQGTNFRRRQKDRGRKKTTHRKVVRMVDIKELTLYGDGGKPKGLRHVAGSFELNGFID